MKNLTADSQSQVVKSTKSSLKHIALWETDVTVPYYLQLSPLIMIKHSSQCYSFNIVSTHHDNEP